MILRRLTELPERPRAAVDAPTLAAAATIVEEVKAGGEPALRA